MTAKYRKDIDGLRAIAILLVIAFHASSYRAPGGFIGVDIFFVISGFLISSIIFTGLDRGEFSYKNFYARRIKRIFPTLLLVLFVAWSLGYYFLFAHELEQLGKHIASGIAFVANIVLWNEAGYFDTSAESKPLLHLWSLGVEEQFYFFYPLVVTALWRFKAYFFWVIGGLSFLSFSLNLYWVQSHDVEAAFYLPISRFWELMIGGALAYYLLYKRHEALMCQWVHHVLATFGLAFILIGFIVINRDVGFPGGWALFPVVGAALLLMSPKSWVNQYVLANKVMVWVGLISYPLYLWHWLLLSLAYILGLDSGLQRLMAVAASFLLAWLTYFFIENNVRYREGYTVHVLALLSMIIFTLGLVSYQGRVIPRHDSPTIRQAVAAVKDWAYPDGLKKVKYQGETFYIKESGKSGKVFFFGDSHIEQYAPRTVSLIDMHPKRTKSVVFATVGGCPPMPDVFRENLNQCSVAFKQKAIKYALSKEVDAVVIGGRWELYLDTNNLYQEMFQSFYIMKGGKRKYLNEGGVEDAKQSLENLLTQLAVHKKVYLLLDNPDIQGLDPKVFLSKQRFSAEVQPLEESIAYTQKQKQLHDEMILMAKRAGAIVIDPIPHFCSNAQCKTTMLDGSPIYKDANHIRALYVRKYVDYIDVIMESD
jgi:peptidoglycan/LPS O-acetylase OafA/YrhL